MKDDKKGPGPENYSKEAMSPPETPEMEEEEGTPEAPAQDLRGAVDGLLKEAEGAGKLDGLKKFLLQEDIQTAPGMFLEAAMHEEALAGKPVDEIVMMLGEDPELLQAVVDALPAGESAMGENMLQAGPRMSKAADEAPEEEEE